MTLPRFSPEDFANDPTLGNGTVDATEAIRAALSALASVGKGILDLTNGFYKVSDQIDLPNVPGLVVEGMGSEVSGLVGAKTFPAGKRLLSSSIAQAPSVSYIASPVSRGASSIVIYDVVRFAVGDDIYIEFQNTSSLGTIIQVNMFNRVVAIEGSTLRLLLPVPCMGNIGTKVSKPRFRSGLRMSGVGFIGTDIVESAGGLWLGWEKGARIEDVSARDFGFKVINQTKYGSGIAISHGFENTLGDASADRCSSGDENAVMVRFQTAARCRGLSSRNSVFGIGANHVHQSQFSDISASCNAGRGVKLWSSRRNQFSNVRVDNTTHTGLAWAGGSSDNQFATVSVWGLDRPEGGNQCCGLWSNGESNDRNTVSGLSCVACSVAAVALAPGDYQTTIWFQYPPADPVNVPSGYGSSVS